MIAVAVVEPGRVEIVDIPKPSPGPYGALVRNQAAFICNATDRKLVAGHFPGIEPDKYPMLLGHENVGTVEEVGSKVRSFKPGDRVIGSLLFAPTDRTYSSGWGGFCEYLFATDHAAMVADGVAAALGADQTFTPDSPVLAKLAARRGAPLDAVIDAVGNQAIINAGLPLIKLGGSLCVYGVVSTPAISHLEFVSGEYPVRETARALRATEAPDAIKTLLRF